MGKVKIGLLLSLLAAPLLLCAPSGEEGDYLLRSWTTAQGLPQDTVYCLLQSRDGYVWLGTDGGLARFDGLHFSVFQRFNAPFLGSTTVTALAEDDQGVLWIGTFGSGLLRLERGRFSRLDFGSGLASNYIWALCHDAEGSLWIGTIGAGLVQLRQGRMTAFSTADGLPDNNVKSIFQDGSGTLWIGTEKGLASRRQEGFKTYGAEAGLFAEHILSIAEDGERRLWLGTSKGLYAHKEGRFTQFPARGQPHPDTVRAILPAKDGRVWLATDNGLKTVQAGESVAAPASELLPDSSLMSLLADDENGIWIGTSGRGVSRIERSPVRILTSQEGLSKDYILSLNQDRSGDIWVGTHGGGVNRLSRGRWRSYAGDKETGIESVYAIEADRAGNVWLGTDSGLWRFQGEVLTHFSRRGGLGNAAIQVLHAGKSGTLWIGTYGGGLHRLREDKLEAFPTPGNSIGAYITAVIEDQTGALWIGSFGRGLCRVQDDRRRTYTAADGLASNDVQCLYEDAAGILWIGSSGGLSVLRGDRLFSITARQGLFDNNIYQILEDGDGHLWLSCNRGIFRIAKADVFELLSGRSREISCLELGEAEGLKSSVCTGGFQPAGLRDASGRLWFPTMKGVVLITPSGILPKIPAHPATVELASVDGRYQTSDQPLRLSPGRHMLGFRFTLPNFSQPQRLAFLYRLDGFERDWNLAGQERSVVYAAVGRGTFRFRVRALFRGADLGEAASPPVVVGAGFLQPAWLIALGALLIAAGGTRAAILRHRRMHEARYRASTLDAAKIPVYQSLLLEVMAGEKPYLDPELSVTVLAERIGMPAKHLSQLINDRFGQNFNEFINRYRIEEALRRLRDPTQRGRKLLAIAFDSGFNSKSVFNAAFKKHTGLSPSQYRRNCLEESPKPTGS